MNEFYSSIYKGFIIVSFISFIILGVMMILLLLFNNIMKISSGQSTMQILSTILLTTGPFLLIIGVVSFILYLMIKYKSIILENHVSNGYHSFSNVTVILILLQLYIVYVNLSTVSFETSGKISKVTSSMVYLLGILSAISSIILFTILKYFTTDGFVPINRLS
jgi:hypothetical protein